MITFQNPNNIIITKRSNYSSQTKKTILKEKTNTQYKNNNKNNYFNKNTLSLTSLKFKSKSKKITKNVINSQIRKKSSNDINTVKNLKNGLYNKKNIENNKNRNFSPNNNDISIKKSKSNQNINVDVNVNNNNDYLLLYQNRINSNVNCKNDNYYENVNNNNNYIDENIGNNCNQFNQYPKPEPMPIKINKNNDFYNNRINQNSNNKLIYSSNLEKNIDKNIKENELKFNSCEKMSNLKIFFENNNNENKNHKRNNTNFINNNYYNEFKQNINNIYNSDNFDKNLNNIKTSEICDKKMNYILNFLELDNLINIFNSNYITFNDLFLLSKQDLHEMNIPIGQRNRLLHFLDQYKNIANNYDFDEVKDFLNKYKNSFKNSLFLEKNKNININNIPNFKKNNINKNNIKNNEINNSNSINKPELFSKTNNNKNDSNKIINNNNNMESETNKSNQGNPNLDNNLKTNLELQTKNIYLNDNNDNYNCNGAVDDVNNNNNNNFENNKNNTIVSSISHSKRTSIEDFNYKDSNQEKNSSMKGVGTQKNYSTITTNIEQNDTTTTTTINNIISSNHFFQKCNKLLNEVDNFNSLYSQLKQRTQNRNKQISLLLSKKSNNVEYFRDKINSWKSGRGRRKENMKTNELYNISNNCLGNCNINELNSLKEENIRNLDRELNYNFY